MNEFRPDGSIILDFPSSRITLRPPTLGQLRILRNMAVEESEAAVKRAEDDPTEVFRDEWIIRWLGEAIKTLSDQSPPDDSDDWPAWVAHFGIVNRFTTHWLTFPLASSDSTTTNPLERRR